MKKLNLGAALASTTVLATFCASQAMASPIPLTLINGWTNAPFGTHTATAETVVNVVHLQGAIATSGTNPAPFVLPSGYRPATDTYVPIDLCDATKGRLYIQPSGTVTVEAETNFSNAQCFTSLDGATFAKNTSGYLNLSLLNGWTNAPFSTSNAAVRLYNGIVRLKGAVGSGTSSELFVLPPTFRPTTNVYAPVDLCNAKNGRLIIQPSGEVDVQAETNFSDAQCFTSLDGVSFGLPAFKPLKLKHGWQDSPYGTAVPGVKTYNGVVHFQGAMVTSGTNAEPFVLPAPFRPTTNVYVPVDMCNATDGRLNITPSGVVSVEAETSFSNAACFTSLDGASFVK